MQHLINKLVTVTILLLTGIFANAQKQDSVTIIKIDHDSIKGYSLHQKMIAKDSVNRKVFRSTSKVYAANAKKYNTINCDSLTKKVFKRMDSLHRLDYKSAVKKYIRSDSLKRIEKKFRDSAFRKINMRLDSLKYMRGDSSYRKMKLYRTHDSLRYIKMKFDNINKLRTQIYIKQKDSVRIKIHLKELKQKLQLLQQDSALLNKLQRRDITMEAPVKGDVTVRIDNIGRKAVVRTTKSNTVRLHTVVYVEANDKLTDAEWFKSINLRLRNTAEGISVEQIKEDKPADKKINLKPVVIVYVPVGTSVYAESNYADIDVENDVDFLKASINNANLDMRNAVTAIIDCKYAGVRAGAITNANLDLLNTKFVCKDIDKLTVDSKHSTLKINNSNEIILKSFGDNYKVTQVNSVHGDKNFGKFEIALLKNSLVLTGANSDLKITDINYTVDLIKLNNKYAELNLPVNNLKAYSLNFEGNNSRLFTTVDKKDQMYALKATAVGGNTPPAAATYSTTVGNVSGSHTKFQINCSSCTVDLFN